MKKKGGAPIPAAHLAQRSVHDAPSNAVHPGISARGKRATSPPSPELDHLGIQRDSAHAGSAIARALSRSPPPTGMPHGCFDTKLAKVLPRIALIVRAAAQTKILNRVL